MNAPATPIEIELKLAIDPDATSALRAHPALRALACGRARTRRVVSTYYDTPDRRLIKDGVALRVRRDGRRILMTVKGSPLPGSLPATSSRSEFEWPIKRPAIEPARLATTPWRALFAKSLRKGGLVPVFTTAVSRTSIPIRFPDRTTATLAIDIGRIDAGASAGRSVPVVRIAEIEFELGDGDPQRLCDLASALAVDLPLAIEPRSKAERGYALADRTNDRPSRARDIEHADHATTRDAIAAIVAECVRQIERNSLGLGTADAGDPEWVHQMRIGVRRLRSCLALADDIVDSARLGHLKHEARWALDALGPSRDLDVFALETLPAVLADLGSAGGGTPPSTGLVRGLARRVTLRRRRAHAAVVECVRSRRFLRFVLATSILATPDSAQGAETAGGAEPAKVFAARLFERRAGRLAKVAGRLAQADADERHQVRIAAKKLRYATEFFASLFPRKRTRTYRKALAELQDQLGVINDVAVAPRVAAALAGPTAASAVAIESWSAARSAQSVNSLDEVWERFAATAPFWQRG